MICETRGSLAGLTVELQLRVEKRQRNFVSCRFLIRKNEARDLCGFQHRTKRRTPLLSLFYFWTPWWLACGAKEMKKTSKQTMSAGCYTCHDDHMFSEVRNPKPDFDRNVKMKAQLPWPTMAYVSKSNNSKTRYSKTRMAFRWFAVKAPLICH